MPERIVNHSPDPAASTIPDVNSVFISVVCMQMEQQANTSAVQSALSHALQHVPLVNGATAGASDQVLRFYVSCEVVRCQVYDVM